MHISDSYTRAHYIHTQIVKPVFIQKKKIFFIRNDDRNDRINALENEKNTIISHRL